MSNYSKLIRSLTKSTETPVRANVSGEIPNWLQGILYRNGPGRFTFGDLKYNHLFDGQACVHKFKIENGEVFYSNKLLETSSYKRTLEENRLFANFGTNDSTSTLLRRLKSLTKSTGILDNVNINVTPYQDAIYATTETNQICKLDPVDLSIKKTINIRKHLPQVFMSIAHPHVESDGSWITMGFNQKSADKISKYVFIRYKNDQIYDNICESGEIIATIPSSYGMDYAYGHSFAISENYIIFLEQCINFKISEYIKGLIFNRPYSSCLVTDKNLPTKIHIINKHTGEVLKKNFITDSQFSFHYINAYEIGNEIVLDMSSYDADTMQVDWFLLENYANKLLNTKMLRATPRRVRIDLNSGNNDELVYFKLNDIANLNGFEFSTINYSKHNGKFYKYVYAVNHCVEPFTVNKINVENSNEIYEMKYPNDIPQEPVFVERPNGTSEDDGVLLVMVLSEKNDYLSILDAKDLTEIARAVLPEDAKGAFTFHGFFADKESFSHFN